MDQILIRETLRLQDDFLIYDDIKMKKPLLVTGAFCGVLLILLTYFRRMNSILLF